MGVLLILRPLLRRWWVVAFVVVPITLLTFLFTVLGPKKYDGHFTIQEVLPSSNSSIKLYEGAAVATSDVETRMNNLRELFAKEKLLVATFTDLAQSGSWGPMAKFGTDQQGQQSAYADFVGRLAVDFDRGTDFLTVHIIGDSQADAQHASEVLKSKFREYYTEVNRQFMQAQRQFIQDQAEDKKKKYEQAYGIYRDYQAKHSGVSFTDTERSMVSEVASLRGVLNDAQRAQLEAVTSQAEAQKMLTKKGFEKMKVSSFNNMLNPTLNGFIVEKAKLENILASEVMVKGPKHPTIIALKLSIEDYNKRINKINASPQSIKQNESVASNPLHDMMKQEVVSRNIQQQVAQTRINEATRQLDSANAKLRAMPYTEQQLAKYAMDTQIAENDVRLMKTKLNEALLRENETVNSAVIKVINEPFTSPVDKKTPIKTMMALALSAVLAISLVLLLNQFDAGTYNVTQTEKALGYNVIAALPKIRVASIPKDNESVSALSASYQMLSTNLLGANGRMHGPAVAITSASSNVGRTTVAANLAVALARDGARVLLVDGDLRQPALHRHFGVENKAGLNEILSNNARMEEVVQPTSVTDLLFISAGQPPVNPVRLFRSAAMAHFIEQASRGTDFIIIDTPAGSTFADAGIIAQSVKNVILVHEAGAPASESEGELTDRLERFGANIVGVVLNKVRYEDAPGYVNYRRSYEASIALRNATAPRGLLNGHERSLTSGNEPTDDDDGA
ncbi:MAG: polysaccharide biosynthesis tyrosine autokinase [bacterium]